MLCLLSYLQFILNVPDNDIPIFTTCCYEVGTGALTDKLAKKKNTLSPSFNLVVQQESATIGKTKMQTSLELGYYWEKVTLSSRNFGKIN